MAMIVPTVEVVGDETLTNSIIDRSITELQDNIITALPNNAMQYCKALKKVVFGAVSSVGMLAFSNCTSLEVADFYKTFALTTRLFMSCGALKALILRGSTVSALSNTNAFEKSGIASGTGYIYVPAALVDSYKTATNWSTYASQIRAIEDYPEVCDPYSWESVATNIENGTYKDVYKIGDMVPVDLGSEGIINMQIAAFDADTLADGSGTAAISWVGKEVLATDYWMNPPRAGSSGAYTEGTGAIGGWEKCAMRSYLQDTIKTLIPESVVSMIKSVTKSQVAYNTAGYKTTQTTTDDLWIPSKEEVYDSGGKYRGLFSNDDSRKKYTTDYSGDGSWWVRTAYDNGGFYFIVGSTGKTNTRSANQEGFHIALGFCTGKTPT